MSIKTLFIFLIIVTFLNCGQVQTTTSTQIEKSQEQRTLIVIDKQTNKVSGTMYFFVIMKNDKEYFYTEDINLYYNYNIGDTIKENEIKYSINPYTPKRTLRLKK